jgi:hypothetical protein
MHDSCNPALCPAALLPDGWKFTQSTEAGVVNQQIDSIPFSL